MKILYHTSALKLIEAKMPERYAMLMRSAADCGNQMNDKGHIEIDTDQPCMEEYAEKYPPPTTTPERKERLARWGKVKQTWEAAKALISRGVTNEKASPETRALRVLSCHGGDGVSPCESRAYSVKNGWHFCNDCGCGEKELARLSASGSAEDQPIFNAKEYDKLDYPYLACPRERPGFSNAAQPGRDDRRKIILHLDHGIGDIVQQLAAVRDLHERHPAKFKTQLSVWCPDVLKHYPYHEVLSGDEVSGAETLKIGGYKDFWNSDTHFSFMFYRSIERALGVSVPCRKLGGGLYLSDEEKARPPIVEGPYWIVLTGYKGGWSTKQWPAEYFQAVVDHFKGRITFVQTGESHHPQPKLSGVIDMMNRPLRDLIVAMYHADGALAFDSMLSHVAAAVPLPPSRGVNRPAVTICAGRTDPIFMQYHNHSLLNVIGSLPCCADGACMRIDDCISMVDSPSGKHRVPECSMLLRPQAVIDAIEMRYATGTLTARLEQRAAEIAIKCERITGATPASDVERLAMMMVEHGAKTVLDFGTHAGRTAAAAIYAGAKTIVTIDDWSGRWNGASDYAEFARRAKSEFFEKLPELAKNRGADLRVVEGDSHSDRKRVAQLIGSELSGRKVDLAWIDASHDTEAVLADIHTATTFTRPGAIVCGHDWNLESVRTAALQSFGPSAVQHTNTIWWVKV